eukprot:2993021-Prymnesium_polylepis.3
MQHAESPAWPLSPLPRASPAVCVQRGSCPAKKRTGECGGRSLRFVTHVEGSATGGGNPPSRVVVAPKDAQMASHGTFRAT